MTRSVQSRKIARFLLPLTSLLSIAACPALAANDSTMESNMSSIMEMPVSRSRAASFESNVTWGRDANFNQSTTLTPGWMLNATAIGNLVNVKVTGAGNTVMVNALQVNNGSQNASIAVGRTNLEARNTQSSTDTTQIQGGPSGSTPNPASASTLSSTQSR